MSSDLSIVMPVFNVEQYIGAAIESALQDADGLLELIVIDDGSTDRTAEIAEGFGDPVRVIRQQNAGPSAARNLGVREARGEMLGFLDGDDLWVAGTPDPRRVLLANGAEVAMGKVMPFVQPDPSQPIRPLSDAPLAGVMFGAMLMRRETFTPIDESLLHGEDLDWVLRMRDQGLRFADADEVVLHYRIRPGSITRDREANRREFVRHLHESIKRRRGQQ